MGKALVKYQWNNERKEWTLRKYTFETFLEGGVINLHRQFFGGHEIAYYLPLKLTDSRYINPIIYIDGVLYNDTMPLRKTMAQKIKAGKKVYFNKLKNVNSFTEPFFVKTYY